MQRLKPILAVSGILLLAFGLGGACAYYGSPSKEEIEIIRLRKSVADLALQLERSRTDDARDHGQVMRSLDNLREHAVKASQACTMAEVLSRNSTMGKTEIK